ncbi:MAG: hypothetical protein NC321_08705 [Clostridium sp.]|nr:hypothetical protein [Clostridium sp.]
MYFSVMDFIYIFTGAYLAYAGIVMKTQGRIIENVVFGKGANENSIRDKEGFMKYLSGRLVIIGIVIILTGIAGLISDYLGSNGIASFVTCAVFVAALVVYGKAAGNAIQKFGK